MVAVLRLPILGQVEQFNSTCCAYYMMHASTQTTPKEAVLVVHCTTAWMVGGWEAHEVSLSSQFFL
jgi:hypothetical protein